MARNHFAKELERYGPRSPFQGGLSEAQRYCETLARSHYENFTVASWFLDKSLQQHFFNIYSWCRWADDLGDEVEDRFESKQLLKWWRGELSACYRGRGTHPVTVALADTIELFSIPEQPFLDLISAFEQDQQRNRYENFEVLLDYCRRSANPVGELVLYLARANNSENVALSDSICTGLQLANFWQDVARDYAIQRIYIPQDDCRRFGYTDGMFAANEFNDSFRELLAFQVERAEKFLVEGKPLIDRVPQIIRMEVDLFVRGGLAILDAVKRQNYNVWQRRPSIGKWNKLKLLLYAWWNR